MNQAQFKLVYNESRNGANQMIRHPLCRKLIYSDGVQELADVGCHWLLDIIGTEVVTVMRGADSMGIITVRVLDTKASIGLSLADDTPDAWTREIEYTDMPTGDWKLYITVDEGECTLILPTEY